MEQKRPGGLTALAVLNFVFGGLGALGVLGMLALVTAGDKLSGGEVTKQGGALLWVAILLSAVSVGLLLASGVGYLGMKKFLGWTLGNAYGLLALAGTAVGLAAGAEFGVFTIVGLIYPILTLVLLNTTFKDDLVN